MDDRLPFFEDPLEDKSEVDINNNIPPTDIIRTELEMELYNIENYPTIKNRDKAIQLVEDFYKASKDIMA